jgi:hypothetical protein
VYENFKKIAEEKISNINKIIASSKEEGYQIVMAGVAAKALTFYHALQYQADLFIDEAPLKIGKFIPGEKKQIESFDGLKEGHKYLVIVGAWNFYDEIREKILSKNPNCELRFLRYFPQIVIN